VFILFIICPFEYCPFRCPCCWTAKWLTVLSQTSSMHVSPVTTHLRTLLFLMKHFDDTHTAVKTGILFLQTTLFTKILLHIVTQMRPSTRFWLFLWLVSFLHTVGHALHKVVFLYVHFEGNTLWRCLAFSIYNLLTYPLPAMTVVRCS